jgi:hypothetical protein
VVRAVRAGGFIRGLTEIEKDRQRATGLTDNVRFRPGRCVCGIHIWGSRRLMLEGCLAYTTNTQYV